MRRRREAILVVEERRGEFVVFDKRKKENQGEKRCSTT